MRHRIAAILLGLTAAPVSGVAQTAPTALQAEPQVEEVSMADAAAMLRDGRVTSEALTAAYLARIDRMDRAGPALRSVIAVNPQALAEARASDARRRAGRPLGPLDGVPVLVKDNIETRDQPTTAGSLALKENFTGRDAPVIARLRAAGMVVLGKTNLSEWANIRSTESMSGWSALGGLVRNPYALDRTACGSSSGTGAAVAASFAAIGIGTETDGSVVCPSSMNGLVGLKPSMGLVSRTHIVPISHSQDTAGPMGRSVMDVALFLPVMIGSDSADPATKDADRYRIDFAKRLKPDALKGRRIGYLRPGWMKPAQAAVYDAALDVLRAAGAEVIEVKMPDVKGIGDQEFLVLQTELKADMDAYLATTPAAVASRTLDDLIAFNRAHADAEMPYFGQEIFETAAKSKGLDDPEYLKARRESQAKAAGAIDAMLKDNDVVVIVAPTYGPAWPSDVVYGDQYPAGSASGLPAISGYPHLTVPMGLVRGLPVGLSFIGPMHGDALLLQAGYAYEQASHARVAPRYLPEADGGAGVDGVR